MGRLLDGALNFIHLLRLSTGGQLRELRLQLLNRLFLLDDRLAERLHRLLDVRQIGLDVDDSLFLRHAPTLHEVEVRIKKIDPYFP